MIILLLVFVGMTVGGIFLNQSCRTEEIGIALIALGAICAICVIVCWPVVYHSYMAQVGQYHAIKSTIEFMRADGIDLMDAAVNLKIIEANAVLAKARYWNRTIFKRAIPDELAELPYLK